MKQVVQKEELKKKMKEAITLLCDAVSSTLGPTGNNILINNSKVSPFITNDGVTIATNIESEDKIINTILEIAKEASLKTNELVGDGTTSTLVLLKSIFLEGLKCIEEGKNPILLKQEMKKTVENIKKEIKKLSKIPHEEDLKNIAKISANDQEISEITWKVFQKVKRKSAIRILESPTNKTFYEINKGYQLETNSLPDYFLENKKEMIIKHPKIILIKDQLYTLEQISQFINENISRNQKMVVIGENFEESVKQEIYIYNKEQTSKIYFIEIPNYASRTRDIMEDIEILTHAKQIDLRFKQSMRWESIGELDEIILRKEEAVLSTKKNEKKVQERICLLEKEIENCTEDYQLEFLEERLAKFDMGIANIYVGGTTKTEKRERKMRFEDCVCAVETAKKGVVPGEGLVYLMIPSFQEEKEASTQILKKAMEQPFLKIMENAGEDGIKRKQEIANKNYEVIYNLEKKVMEKTSITNVIDPTEVVITALENAVSIASMLLTTQYLVINEWEPNESTMEI